MDFGAQSIEGFLGAIASETVAPAGGSAVATTGAMGAALCEMTCVHTLENDPAEVRIDLVDLRDQLRTNRRQFLRLAGQDARAVETIFSAPNRDPARTETERLLRIPVSIAEVGLDVMEIGSTLVDGVDRAVVADAKTGVMLADAAFEGALWIATSNLDRVSDRSLVDQVEERVEDLGDARDRIAEEMSDRLLSDRPGS